MKASGWFCGAALGLLLGSSVLPGAAAAAEGFQLQGSLYALGSQRRVKLYLWEMTVCPELWTSRYRRLDGTLVVEDFTRFAGRRLAEHGYVRHTMGERSSVRVRGSRLEFRYQRGAAKKVAALSTDGVFLTGPAVFPSFSSTSRSCSPARSSSSSTACSTDSTTSPSP